MPARSRRLALAGLTAALAAGGVTAGVVTAAKTPSDVQSILTDLKDGTGATVGTVEFRKSPRSATYVYLTARGLTPGYHGFHVHAVGTCDAPAFTTAMGHLKEPGQSHGDHTGDFPPLLVKRDGTASARFQTDRFDLASLRDADGSAVMLHAGPDNLANVPPRYAPGGPDQATKDTGDSGARIACAAIAPTAPKAGSAG